MNELRCLKVSDRFPLGTKCFYCGHDMVRQRSFINKQNTYVSTVYCEIASCLNSERATSIVSQDHADAKAALLFAINNVPDCACGSCNVQVIHNAADTTFDCVIKCHTCGRIVAGLSAASQYAACRNALKNWKEVEL